MNKIIALSLLSSSIMIYTKDLKIWKEIKPKISGKKKKQFVILSFGYDQKNQRVGCILKNLGLHFSEFGDLF